jgi:UDP-N-acetylmuramoyl-tripeptide--D-alanyl-D-alanine ligase
MIAFQLSEAAHILDGRLHGRDARFSAVGTDTRRLRGGELFIALSGPNFDGHDYIGVAAQQGAVGALVQHRLNSAMPQVEVEDTRRGMGRLARAWRRRSGARVVAVTGSNGKTTVKEMLAAILGRVHPVLATQGNLNNDIGMPLTLMRLQDETHAVVEMGANHAGEIAYLSRIAEPDVAILNNAGRAHLEGFGSVEGVARAKAEILEGLRPDGVFVYNADDPNARLWRALSVGRRCLGFGLDETAEVRSPEGGYRLEWLDDHFEASFPVITPEGELDVRLRLAGQHNRMNALAAIAAALALGISLEDIGAGLAAVRPVPGRLCPLPGRGGARLVDDSYNANPDSVEAAMAVLMQMPGRHLLVLGDLGELGEAQAQLHAGLGRQAAHHGLDILLGCGPLSAHACEAFGPRARHFETRAALIEWLRDKLGAEDSVLVKGSRASAMDQVIRALAREDAPC